MASLRAVAESVNAKLMERGLAKTMEDGVSVPMHPVVRITADAAEYFGLPRERTVIVGSRIEV